MSLCAVCTEKCKEECEIGDSCDNFNPISKDLCKNCGRPLEVVDVTCDYTMKKGRDGGWNTEDKYYWDCTFTCRECGGEVDMESRLCRDQKPQET